MYGPAPATHVDIVIPPYLQSWEGLANLEGLDVRLVQCLTLGYDGVAEFLPKNMVFANAASVHEPSTAEMTLALILASQRYIPDFVRAAEAGKWAPVVAPEPRRSHGAPHWLRRRRSRHRVATVALRSDRRAARAPRARRRTRSHLRHRLAAELLPFADIVVVAVLLDESTHHLVDAEFLSLMPDGSLFVNIARGGVADTDALLAEARSGRLRLALDVTDPEPLPDGHPLFALDERPHLTARGRHDVGGHTENPATHSRAGRSPASRRRTAERSAPNLSQRASTTHEIDVAQVPTRASSADQLSEFVQRG